jgi:hypothetical protein
VRPLAAMRAHWSIDCAKAWRLQLLIRHAPNPTPAIAWECGWRQAAGRIRLPHWSVLRQRQPRLLSKDEARRVAVNIAKLDIFTAIYSSSATNQNNSEVFRAELRCLF